MQSQVRAPEKVPEKVPGGFGAEPWSMLMCFQRLASQHASARFRKICTNRTLRLLGIPP